LTSNEGGVGGGGFIDKQRMNGGGGGGGGEGLGFHSSLSSLSLSHTQLLRQICDKDEKNSRLGETAKERNGGER